MAILKNNKNNTKQIETNYHVIREITGSILTLETCVIVDSFTCKEDFDAGESPVISTKFRFEGCTLTIKSAEQLILTTREFKDGIIIN